MDIGSNPSYAPLFSFLDKRLPQGPLRLAIDGSSASGKSTLGAYLCSRYDGTLFHMDDFFLRPEQRTDARYAEPGGNVDRERFQEEVLEPLARGQEIHYRKLDCSTFRLMPPELIRPKAFIVTEGAYSMHPDLAGYYDFSVFLAIDPLLQAERVLQRNGPAKAAVFRERWIPLEKAYFEAFHIAERCDMVIQIR